MRTLRTMCIVFMCKSNDSMFMPLKLQRLHLNGSSWSKYHYLALLYCFHEDVFCFWKVFCTRVSDISVGFCLMQQLDENHESLREGLLPTGLSLSSLCYKTKLKIFDSRESSLFQYGLKQFTNVLNSYISF